VPKTTSEDAISESKYTPTFEDDISNLKGRDLAQFLRMAESSLRETFKTIYPDSTYYQFKKDAFKVINSDKVNHSSIAKCWGDTKPCETLQLTSTHREDFFYAYAYTYRAEKELEHNAESVAWPIFLQAMYYIGLLDGYTQLNCKLKKDIEARSKGGNSTSSIYDPLRDEAARLLITKTSVVGWKTHDKAAEGVQDQLEIFAKDNNIEHLLEDAYEFTKNQLNKKNSDIRKTYDIVNATCKALTGINKEKKQP
jgi:hypothetical protein